MTDLSIICALWQGDWKGVGKTDNRQYSPVYAERLKDMLEKNTSYDFDFVCMSNIPASEFRRDIIVRPFRSDLPAWWSRIDLFDPEFQAGLNKRVVTIDIDILIVKNIDELINYPSDFVVHNVWSYSTFKNRSMAIKRARSNRDCRLVPFYGLDVMVFGRNARPQLYTEFDEKYISDLCGMQDWMSVCLGENESRFPLGWGRKLKRTDRGTKKPKFGKAFTIACHPIKNHLLKRNGYIWCDKLWRGLV